MYICSSSSMDRRLNSTRLRPAAKLWLAHSLVLLFRRKDLSHLLKRSDATCNLQGLRGGSLIESPAWNRRHTAWRGFLRIARVAGIDDRVLAQVKEMC